MKLKIHDETRPYIDQYFREMPEGMQNISVEIFILRMIKGVQGNLVLPALILVTDTTTLASVKSICQYPLVLRGSHWHLRLYI